MQHSIMPDMLQDEGCILSLPQRLGVKPQQRLAYPVAEQESVFQLGEPGGHKHTVTNEEVLEWDGLIE